MSHITKRHKHLKTKRVEYSLGKRNYKHNLN